MIQWNVLIIWSALPSLYCTKIMFCHLSLFLFFNFWYVLLLEFGKSDICRPCHIHKYERWTWKQHTHTHAHSFILFFDLYLLLLCFSWHFVMHFCCMVDKIVFVQSRAYALLLRLTYRQLRHGNTQYTFHWTFNKT